MVVQTIKLPGLYRSIYVNIEWRRKFTKRVKLGINRCMAKK